MVARRLICSFSQVCAESGVEWFCVISGFLFSVCIAFAVVHLTQIANQADISGGDDGEGISTGVPGGTSSGGGVVSGGPSGEISGGTVAGGISGGICGGTSGGDCESPARNGCVLVRVIVID